MGEMHPKKKKGEIERENVCACSLHSIWHMIGVNLFGQMLGSDHHTANPRAFPHRVTKAISVWMDSEQGTHTATLCTHHPEKPGPFPKGSEDRPHTHGNSVCASCHLEQEPGRSKLKGGGDAAFSHWLH